MSTSGSKKTSNVKPNVEDKTFNNVAGGKDEQFPLEKRDSLKGLLYLIN